MKIIKKVGIGLLVIAIIVSMATIYLFRGMDSVKEIEIGEINLEEIDNGVYEGDFSEGFRWSNTVSVSVYDNKIIEISVMKNQQSIHVDVVAGATLSSKAYLKAIENALR